MKISHEEIKVIYERRLNGEKLKDLAKEYGICPEPLSKRISSHIASLTSVDTTKKYTPKTRTQVEELLERVKWCESQIELLQKILYSKTK